MVHLGIDVGGSSVKLAALAEGQTIWTAQSSRYANPSPTDIAAAIAEATAGRAVNLTAVGICVPGILSPDRSKIELAVNLPALQGISLEGIVKHALGRATDTATFYALNDTNAAAYDIYFGRKLSGRLCLLALGTGVGACVMDESGPVRVDGDSPGHFGQLDVSIEGHPVIGPDGGAGSLEGYIGAPALAAAYGTTSQALDQMKVTDPAGRALVRTIRIAHALFRPHHVVLAGGVGTRLGRLLPELQAATNQNLTRIARAGWTLSVGESDFHNAAGAARAAGMAGPVPSPSGRWLG
jgi:predicted NBD/HSP70 family sugar kinase